jgi:hypothetical protein
MERLIELDVQGIDLTQSSHQRQIMSILNFPYMHNMSA